MHKIIAGLGSIQYIYLKAGAFLISFPVMYKELRHDICALYGLCLMQSDSHAVRSKIVFIKVTFVLHITVLYFKFRNSNLVIIVPIIVIIKRKVIRPILWNYESRKTGCSFLHEISLIKPAFTVNLKVHFQCLCPTVFSISRQTCILRTLY